MKNMRLNSPNPRNEVATKKVGSFAESLNRPPPYPLQKLRSSGYPNKNIYDDDCDSSSSSSSGSGSEYESDDLARKKELSASGSFAESLRLESASGFFSGTAYPQSCLIPSLSDTPNELSMKMLDTAPPPPLQPSCNYHSDRRQIFKQESGASISSGEHRIIGISAGQHPKSSCPILCNNTQQIANTNNNNNGNLTREDTNTDETFATKEWLQTTADCYSNSHGHTLLPVVLEEDECAAISNSPDSRENDRKECKIETKELKIDTKMTNLCSSTNGESLHSILLNHKSCDDEDRHHFGNNDIDNLKVDPGTETIGGDTYQTQSLSYTSSSSFNTSGTKDHELCPSPSANTHCRHLEEELDSRLQVIMALKDVILNQNRTSKKAARLSKKTNSKLISCTRANKKLTKQNEELEEQTESLKKELEEMKVRMVEAEMKLKLERPQLSSRIGEMEKENDDFLNDIASGIAMKDKLSLERSIDDIEFSDDDDVFTIDNYTDEGNEMASF